MAALWPSGGGLEELLEPPGAVLGRFWAILGWSWAALGAHVGGLEAS